MRWFFPAILSTFLLVALLSACATVNVGAQKPFAQMSPQEKATFFQDFYNKQYDDTMAMGKMANLSEAQLKVYRAKRELLKKAYPAIKLYKAIADGGGIPTPQDEAAILQLINELAAAGS
jgi:hypothetical protein